MLARIFRVLLEFWYRYRKVSLRCIADSTVESGCLKPTEASGRDRRLHGLASLINA